MRTRCRLSSTPRDVLQMNLISTTATRCYQAPCSSLLVTPTLTAQYWLPEDKSVSCNQQVHGLRAAAVKWAYSRLAHNCNKTWNWQVYCNLQALQLFAYCPVPSFGCMQLFEDSSWIFEYFVCKQLWNKIGAHWWLPHRKLNRVVAVKINIPSSAVVNIQSLTFSQQILIGHQSPSDLHPIFDLNNLNVDYVIFIYIFNWSSDQLQSILGQVISSS